MNTDDVEILNLKKELEKARAELEIARGEIEKSQVNLGQNLHATHGAQAGQTVETGNHFYRQLFNSLPGIYALYQILFDENDKPLDAVILDMNDLAVKRSGMIRGKIIGKKAYELFPALSPLFLEKLALAEKIREPISWDFSSAVTGHYYELYIYSPEKGKCAVIGIDATEKRNAQAALRESEWKYRRLYESMQEGVVLTDLAGHILECNRAYREMLGYTESELKKLGYQDITPARWLGWEENAIVNKQVIPNGYSEPYEKEYIRNDGTIFPVGIRAWLATDENGNPVGIWSFVREITKRKEAEAALRISEKKFRSLFESTLDAIAMTDLDGRIVEANQAYLDMLGYSIEDIRNFTYNDLTPVKWHEIESEIIQSQTMRQGSSEVYDKEYIRKDGTIFPVSLRTSLIRDNRGKPVGFWKIARDMTESKRTEQALIESEKRFRTLFEEMISGFALHEIIIDEKGKPVDYRFLEVNSGFEKLTGLRRENIIGKTVKEVIPGVESFWIERYGNVALTGEPLEFVGHSADLGKYYEAKAFRPEAGKFAVIFNDVTERRDTEIALKSSENRFRTLFDSMINSVSLNEIVEDENGEPVDAIFLEVNPAFEQMTGLKREDIIGKREYDIFPFFDRRWIKICGKVARTGVSTTMEQHNARLDRYYTLKIYSPGNGKFAVIREDITEKRKAEERLKVQSKRIQTQNEELARQNEEMRLVQEELEKRLDELRLAHDELDKKIQELKSANEELQRFAYVASHDLQEPLRMISSYLQLLERRYKNRLDRDANEFIDFAVNGAKRLQKMIESLLEYSRVETRGEPFKEFSSDEALDDALDNLEVAIVENEAVISRKKLPLVLGDAGQISRVFQNLISNSLRFRSKERPNILISASRQDGEWLFSIRDNGIGIDPQYHDKIFVIFQRLHGHDYPGTGIGLSISKRIIERHGGRIYMDSEPGKGSTFYFTLPALTAADSVDNKG